MILPNLAGIAYESVVDGPGVRTAIFLSGCHHHCPGCHNLEAQNPNFGTQMTEEDIEYIADYIGSRPYISGITLTGGDPLFWPENTYNFLVGLVEYSMPKSIWVYTGYVYEKIPNDRYISYILNMTDVLVDGPFIKELADKRLAFRGSSNQRLIDLRKTRENGEVVLWNG